MKFAALGAGVLLLAGCAARRLPPENSLSGETSILGCLNYDQNLGQYVLTDRTGKVKTVVLDNPDLSRHGSNHAVRVTGMLNREISANGLKAIRIEHVAASCQVPF